MTILDVKVKTKSKKVIDIEIQVKPTTEMKERVLFYSSKMITEQVGFGGKFHKIKRVISIIITDYVLIAESEKYHHRFTLYDYENNVEFTDIIEVNTLELTKIPQAEDGTELWNWMKFLSAEREEDLEPILKNETPPKNADFPPLFVGTSLLALWASGVSTASIGEKSPFLFGISFFEDGFLDMIATKSPQIKKAVVRLMELSSDEKTRMLYESRQKLEWDIQARERATVRTIAKNMIKRNRPIAEIIEDTGLDYDEVEFLQNADF